MRGANPFEEADKKTWRETSPHAWSKLSSISKSLFEIGNISTCVEQTVCFSV